MENNKQKKINYYLASLIMEDLADDIKEGSNLLIDREKIEEEINEDIKKEIEETREYIKSLLPEDRWKFAKKITYSDKLFSLIREEVGGKIRDKIFLFIEKGKTDMEIAALLSISVKYCQEIIRDEKHKILTSFDKGKTDAQIAETLNTSAEVVKKLRNRRTYAKYKFTKTDKILELLSLGKSYKEIAQELDCTTGSIRSLLSLRKKRLTQ